MFIDTHCHLADNPDVTSYIDRAYKNNIKKFVCASAEYDDIPKIIKLINKFDCIYATLGIHPEYCKEPKQNFITDEIINNKKILGIGEIGLDYYKDDNDRIEQIKLFEWQLNLAEKFKMPIAIHTRCAEKDTYNTLAKTGVKGVLHCFTGSFEFASKMLDKGFFVSASGIITFKNANDLRDTFKKIPIDRIVVETDSPYLAPVPFRGQNCESFMMIETIKTLALIKNLNLKEIENILLDNTNKLYPRCQEK